MASREPDATEAEVQRGTKQSNELSAVVNQFILRRTNALLSAHLPPKVPKASHNTMKPCLCLSIMSEQQENLSIFISVLEHCWP